MLEGGLIIKLNHYIQVGLMQHQPQLCTRALGRELVEYQVVAK